MCISENGNRELVCKVGDLQPGQQYRDPDGNTMMVTDCPAMSGQIAVANLSTGKVTFPNTNIRLGHDKQGRLYASRYLNPPPDSMADGSDKGL